MHVPVEVHVEDIEQTVTALPVAIPTYRIEKVLDYNVTTDDLVHCPAGIVSLSQDMSARDDRIDARTFHSVPRYVTPGGERRKTSQPFIRTCAPSDVISRLPARIWSSVDFPADKNQYR
jgi:hypothetical protein